MGRDVDEMSAKWMLHLQEMCHADSNPYKLDCANVADESSC